MYYDIRREILVVQCAEESWIGVEQVHIDGKPSPVSAKVFTNAYIGSIKKNPAIGFIHNSSVQFSVDICPK